LESFTIGIRYERTLFARYCVTMMWDLRCGFRNLFMDIEHVFMSVMAEWNMRWIRRACCDILILLID